MKRVINEDLLTRPTLVERLGSATDSVAWSEFYRQYWRVMYNYARKKGCSEALASEVVQDAVLKLYAKMANFQYDPAQGRFLNKVLTTTHFACLDAFRREQRRREISLEAEGDAESGSGRSLMDRTNDEAVVEPDEALWENTLDEETLARALQRLTPRERAIISGGYFERKSGAALAKELGLSVSNVNVIRNRTKKKLKTYMTEIRRELIAMNF